MRNKAKCRNCGDIIESKTRHDFVMCKCYRESQRRVNHFKEKHKKVDKVYWDFVNGNLTGFFLDGGRDYVRCGGNFEHIEWIDDEVS
jgi:hypothetical protein